MTCRGFQILPETIQPVEKVFLQGYYFPLKLIVCEELKITFEVQIKSKLTKLINELILNARTANTQMF
jgi:hypothetical protein